MSYVDWEDEGIEEISWEDCFYDFEFCSDPETKSMGLCTTECSVYLDSLRDREG